MSTVHFYRGPSSGSAVAPEAHFSENSSNVLVLRHPSSVKVPESWFRRQVTLLISINHYVTSEQQATRQLAPCFTDCLTSIDYLLSQAARTHKLAELLLTREDPQNVEGPAKPSIAQLALIKNMAARMLTELGWTVEVVSTDNLKPLDVIFLKNTKNTNNFLDWLDHRTDSFKDLERKSLLSDWRVLNKEEISDGSRFPEFIRWIEDGKPSSEYLNWFQQSCNSEELFKELFVGLDLAGEFVKWAEFVRSRETARLVTHIAMAVSKTEVFHCSKEVGKGIIVSVPELFKTYLPSTNDPSTFLKIADDRQFRGTFANPPSLSICPYTPATKSIAFIASRRASILNRPPQPASSEGHSPVADQLMSCSTSSGDSPATGSQEKHFKARVTDGSLHIPKFVSQIQGTISPGGSASQAHSPVVGGPLKLASGSVGHSPISAEVLTPTFRRHLPRPISAGHSPAHRGFHSASLLGTPLQSNSGGHSPRSGSELSSAASSSPPRVFVSDSDGELSTHSPSLTALSLGAPQSAIRPNGTPIHFRRSSFQAIHQQGSPVIGFRGFRNFPPPSFGSDNSFALSSSAPSSGQSSLRASVSADSLDQLRAQSTASVRIASSILEFINAPK